MMNKVSKIVAISFGLLFSCIPLLYPQEHIFSVKIIDGEGNAVPGVLVRNDSDSLTVSSKYGWIRLNVVPEIKSVYLEKQGFISRKMNIGNSDGYSIVLNRIHDSYEIPEAFLFTESGSLNSSVSFTRGDDLDLYPARELSSALTGKLKGLTVLETSGDVTVGGPELLIRGKGTLGDNTLLTFVDGFENTIDQLVPEEIETVAIFKDAASLAPFGTRGANGVIWITTKKGIDGDMRVRFKTESGFSQAIELPSFLDAAGYASFYNEAISNDVQAWYPVYSLSDIDTYRNGTDPQFFPNVNWYDEVLSKTAPFSNNSLTIKGGNQMAKYFVLLGYRFTDKLYKERINDEFVNLKNTGQTGRINFRTNLDLNLNQYLSSSVRIGGMIQDDANPAVDNLFDLIAKMPPNSYPVINYNDTYGGNAIYPTNPVGIINDMGAMTTHQRWLQAGISLKLDLSRFAKGLSLDGDIDLSNYYTSSYDQLRNIATFKILDETIIDSTSYIQYGDNTTFEITEGNRRQWSRVNFAVSARHNARYGILGINSVLTYRQSHLLNSDKIPFFYANLAGQANLDLKKTYFAGIAISYSGSQNFAEGNRFGFFPAASLGWLLSNNTFIKNLNFINTLKIRGSAGLTGNDLGSRFAYITYFPSGGTYYFGASGIETQSTLREGNLGNPNITWESGYKYNLGLETRMLDNSLEVILDFFIENRKNIVGYQDLVIPSAVGASLPLQNLSEVNSKGYEASIYYYSKPGSFEYHLGGMLCYARNIVDYTSELYSEDYLYRSGNPVDQPFGLEALGFFNSWEEINDPLTPVQTFGPVQPGDIRYRDQNGDGLITEEDEVPIGFSNIPEYNYAFDVYLKYKRFDLNLFLSGVGNRSVYLTGDYIIAFRNNTQMPAIAQNRWVYYPDDGLDTRNIATYPRLSTTENKNNYRRSTFWTENGSFLRLRKIEIGYNLPMKNNRDSFVENLRISITGFNLFTWDNLEYFDAEVLTGYPLLKSYMIGLKMNF